MPVIYKHSRIIHYIHALFAECGGKIKEKNWNERKRRR